MGRYTAPVTLRVANGENMEGKLDEAGISLQFVRHEELLRANFGQRYQIKGLFYEADLPERDMIMGFDLLDIAYAGVLPHMRTLLVEEADKLRALRQSMEPESSGWELAELDLLAQVVRSVSTRPPAADIEEEYGLSEGAFHMALGELGLSTSEVDVFGTATLRSGTGFGPKRTMMEVWMKQGSLGSAVYESTTRFFGAGCGKDCPQPRPGCRVTSKTPRTPRGRRI